METIKQKTDSLDQLKKELDQLKDKKRNTWESITGVPSKNILIMDDSWISFDCENTEQLKGVLNNIVASKTGWKIDHTNCQYFTGLYRIDIENGYYSRELKIRFENNTGLKVWATIPIDNVLEKLSDFLMRHNRALHNTENHYVNLPSHYKKFKNIRIPAYSFYSDGVQVGWYGGNKTLTDTQTQNEIIEILKS